MIDLQLL